MRKLKNSGREMISNLKKKKLGFNSRSFKKDKQPSSQKINTSDEHIISQHQEIVSKIDALIAQMDNEQEKQEQIESDQFTSNSVSITQ